jgi:methylase of polypeptide subunit release factors
MKAAAHTLPIPRAARSCTYGPLVVEYDERVLAPRPWTLMQSTWAAQLAPTLPPGCILELCAVAGHIGLAAAILADRDLVQVEADPVAAGYALRNAARAGRADRVEVRPHPMAAALAQGESFPLMVADPPYLPSAEVSLWPEDPVRAIDGGADGLDLIRACLDVAARHLVPGGRLLLQVAGTTQAAALQRLLGVCPSLTLAEQRVHDAARAVVMLARR